ncbi:MAG: Asp23/Gls24 family envelope stress response protein [Ruminococcaceae bacterium]|nr:Asp23/Gls24 family envelope stress response protein [Oscillospiraceae bacterium]
MADRKDYLVQSLENGNIWISEEVIASIAALAVRDVDGVYGLSTSATLDLGNIIGKKNLRRGIKVNIDGEKIDISCNLVVKYGEAVMDIAKQVQEAINSEVTSMTGITPNKININVCGVATPKTATK